MLTCVRACVRLITNCAAALEVTVARLGRRVCRPMFMQADGVTPKSTKIIYDALTFVAHQALLACLRCIRALTTCVRVRVAACVQLRDAAICVARARTRICILAVRCIRFRTSSYCVRAQCELLLWSHCDGARIRCVHGHG
jgi:hypothetical protein